MLKIILPLILISLIIIYHYIIFEYSIVSNSTKIIDIVPKIFTKVEKKVKREKPLYLRILENVSKKVYCRGKVGCFRYTCADFTADAVRFLREAGYDAYPVCGWVRVGNRSFYHAWVALELNGSVSYFEPQTAENVTDNPNYYRARRCVVRGVY